MTPQSSAPSTSGRVASSGAFRGISPVMGAATLALVLGFSALTVIDVEFAGKLFGTAGAWIAAALPFSIVMLIMAYGLVKSLAREPLSRSGSVD